MLASLRDGVNIRLIGLNADERGVPSDEYYVRRAAAMLDELVWFSGIMRPARTSRAKQR